MTEERYDDDFLFDEGEEHAGEDFLDELDAAANESDAVDPTAAADDDDLFLIEGLGVEEDAAQTGSPTADAMGTAPDAPQGGLEAMFRTSRPPAPATGEPDVEDMLFGATRPRSGHNFEGSAARPDFHEEGGAWAGDDVNLEELVGSSSAGSVTPPDQGSMGMEERGEDEEEDLFQIEDVEIELVDEPHVAEAPHGTELRPIARDPETSWSGDEAEETEPTVAGTGGASSLYDELRAMDSSAEDLELQPEPQSFDIGAETWSEEEPVELPPDHEDYDAIYGPDARAEDEEEYYEEQDWSDYEDEYVDEPEQAPAVRVVGPGRPRRSRLLMAASAAAVLLVAGGGGAVAWLHPEWLGLSGAPPIVSRVDVARPTVVPELAPPPAPAGESPVVDPVTDPIPEPTVPDPVAIDPLPDPPVTDPEIDPDPEAPVVVEAPPRDRRTDPAQGVAAESLELGDELEVREAGPMTANVAPFPELAVGSRAFAQLHNSEFFIGTVKKRDAQQVTLRLEVGEVSLHYASLRTLAPLGVEETGEVTEAADGFVRLNTRQRLFGTLIRTRKSDEIIVRTEDARISVPEETILDVGIAKKGAASPVLDDDDQWLDRLARERLLGGSSTETRGTAESRPPAPAPRGR